MSDNKNNLRVDKVLVAIGLAPSRSQALQLIKEKVVFYNDLLVTKASFVVSDSELLEVRKDFHFVGRGAHKIEGAHLEFGLDFSDKIVADVGASTGGFTQYVLKAGAKKVYAIDVGHDQLSPVLREDERVINMEGTNVRELTSLPEVIDFAVVDLSFISLKLVIQPIKNLLKNKGELLLLVKPQFEVGREYLGKKGIVTDMKKVDETLSDLDRFFHKSGVVVLKKMPCTLKGKAGNQEYLYYCQKEESPK